MEKIDKEIETEKSAGQVDQGAGKDMGGPEGGFGDPSRGVEQEPDWNNPNDWESDGDEPED